jgi:predicted negative regulator of RcsB-dependent stress response
MTRHELRSQDEISSTIQRLTETAVTQKKPIIAGAVVLLVLVGGFVGWRVYSANRNANAQTELSAAINAFNDSTNIPNPKERYEKSLAAAQKTYDDYGSSSIGPIAKYYVAMSQAGLGDSAKAVQTLQEVISSGDAGVKAVAQFALGGIYKKNGEYQKALDAYKQLYDSGGYSKSALTLELAKTHEANKQPDQAKDYYLKVISEFPDSPFRTDADQALKRLGVAAPPPSPSSSPS